jgi:hypothetical protein
MAALLCAATDAFQAGNLESCRAILSRAISLDPFASHLYLMMAEAAETPAAALSATERFLQLNSYTLSPRLLAVRSAGLAEQASPEELARPRTVGDTSLADVVQRHGYVSLLLGSDDVGALLFQVTPTAPPMADAAATTLSSATTSRPAYPGFAISMGYTNPPPYKDAGV